ncbi:37S ribosomal protein Mrp10 [Truncatella angustata]|uniref:Small ribosomal subunit protein mS37 n=1 Tax=Truncatella angustata TaxID=152316 RepID=A0A9P8USV5_9PEZI|nr:37S ribosomal protein Mrp10 [Truncatella angustata]KAH6657623.1 37S ribosomal protein Mrp10 [Truncatella angustata]
MTGTQRPMRLPPLKVLRVKNPTRQGEQPCMAIMSSVLACWASAGYNTAGCAQMETALRACMDGPQPSAAKRSEINYHLSRFHERVSGVKKP